MKKTIVFSLVTMVLLSFAAYSCTKAGTASKAKSSDSMSSMSVPAGMTMDQYMTELSNKAQQEADKAQAEPEKKPEMKEKKSGMKM